jgi:hypothetical protein
MNVFEFSSCVFTTMSGLVTYLLVRRLQWEDEMDLKQTNRKDVNWIELVQ